MNICLFSNDEINKPLDAFDERAIHLDKVLHKNVGDTFSAGIINGKAGIATITKVIETLNEKSQKIQRGFEFTFEATNDGKPLNPLILIVGFPRPIQLKRAMRDAAGLGVKEIHLTATELGEKSYIKSKMVEQNEISKFLLDGSVQAASTHVPEVMFHNSLAECLAFVESRIRGGESPVEDTSSLRNTITREIDKPGSVCAEVRDVREICDVQDREGRESQSAVSKILLDNIKPQISLQKFMTSNSHKCVLAAIGSERGWTDNERNLFVEKGFTLCSMGERVLRTETALTVSASIILSNMGLLN